MNINFAHARFLEYSHYNGIVGILFIIGFATLVSKHRSHIPWKTVINGLVLQCLLAFFILKTRVGHLFFEKCAHAFSSVYQFAGEGARFVFGNLSNPAGGWGFIFAVQVVAIIIFFGALMSLLFHLGIIQLIVKAISFLIRPLLGTSGAETLCAAANSMLGQTEAPLLIKHYLIHMTDSEMLVVMVSGFATISGSLLAVYGSMGISMVHLLAASVMAIPSSIVIAKILLPEMQTPQTQSGSTIPVQKQTKNMLDALSSGTSDGMNLAVNVLAMLISFISFIALINSILFNSVGYTLNDFFAALFAPIAFLIGIPRGDISNAGALLGQKLVINEFVAYSQMATYDLAARSKIILTYALCGFANFSCIGIQIGGIGALAPHKRDVLTRLSMRALLGGTLANLLNAAIASLLI